MAADIELKEINEFVASLSEVTDLHGSYIYGIDRDGNSIKVATEDISELDDKSIASDWLEVDTGEGSGNVYTHGGSGGGASSEEIEALRKEIQQFATQLLDLSNTVNSKSNNGHKHEINDINGLAAQIEAINNSLNELRTNAENLVKKEDFNALKERVDDLENPTYDSELSNESENAVQNKVLNAALDKKVNDIDLSDVAKSGSYNDLLDKPEIPAKLTASYGIGINNNAEIRVKVDGATVKFNEDDELTAKTNITIDSALSDISENPVQNKIVKSALDEKAATQHKHLQSDINGLQENLARIDTLRENLATTNLAVVDLQNTVAQIRSKDGLRLIDNLETYEGTDGEIVMYTGVTTDKYENGFTYQAERGTFTLPAGTEYIEVNNDYPNTVHGIYAKTGETLEDISCNITDYTNTLGDGKTYKSVDYDILQVGDKVWDTDGNLYTINEKTDFGNLTLDNGTIITRNNTTESFSKAVVYTSPTSGEKIYKVTAAPLYLGTLRGTSLYCEGIGYYFDGSCTENVATETMVFETLTWMQKNNQPDFREWFEWNNI